MTNAYPMEFRRDVVQVARHREPGVSLEKIAADFGIHPITLSTWLKYARKEPPVDVLHCQLETGRRLSISLAMLDRVTVRARRFAEATTQLRPTGGNEVALNCSISRSKVNMIGARVSKLAQSPRRQRSPLQGAPCRSLVPRL
jgi:transposase-like protein